MNYPIITKTKQLRQIEINGQMQWVAETITRDYGPAGKTVVHILATQGTDSIAHSNRANLNTAVGRFGYRIIN